MRPTGSSARPRALHNRLQPLTCHSLGCRSRAAKRMPLPCCPPTRSRRSLERRPPASARLAAHSTTTDFFTSRHTGSSTTKFRACRRSSCRWSRRRSARDGFVLLPDVYDMTLERRCRRPERLPDGARQRRARRGTDRSPRAFMYGRSSCSGVALAGGRPRDGEANRNASTAACWSGA